MTRLRSLLLRWLLIPTLVLWALGFAAGYLRNLAQANRAYDRTLVGAAMVMRDQLNIAPDGEIMADVPAAALEMLRTDAHDRVFYRISEWPGGRHITGYEDLPAPAEPASSLASFDEWIYKGQPVRGVALGHTLLDKGRPRQVLVQVAETLEARRALTRRIVADAASLQLLLIAASAGLIALGVQRGLAPLRKLRDDVRARGADDLAPIDTHAVPREVVPLIRAINLHAERQKQLAATQRRFIASASHQLKTPLTVLRAQAAHAMQQTDLHAMRAAVAQLHEATHATSHLVQQMLALARAEPGRLLEPEDLDLAELARELCVNLLPLARSRSIDLGFDGEQTVTVRGESLMLREMLANLVDNALRHTPSGGQVTVSVGVDASGRALLQVDDSGPGLPEPEHARVLEAFYRVPGSPAEGSGLGLAIVKQVCDRHGLTLRFGTPAPGTGEAAVAAPASLAVGPGLRVQVLWPVPNGIPPAA